ncbi:MAG: ParB N-terminal domain-containing protein [Planctomycetes bacterium]|nr:ParB N-terminal domain-containing protein [Planctomycetota bacterium]
MKIELRPLAEIKPYEKNPRLNDAAVDAVAESIRRFGFRQPIVVDADGVIVCGHTRWKAARQLGLTEVPVHVATDLTPAQIRAYRIADNKTAELAEWNLELLPIELAELQDAGIDWSLLGFDADELAELLDPGVQDGQCDPDDVPEPPDEATTQPGDLWIMGDHRLLCGDSGSVADVNILIAVDPAKALELPAGSSVELELLPIHLCHTDPPYNVKVEPRSNNAIAAGLSSFGEHGLMHHQSFDLHRAEKKQSESKKEAKRTASKYHGFDVATGAQSGKATHTKLRPKDRPLINDFVSDEEFDKMLRAWFGNIARVLAPGRGFYIWGGYANIGNYPGPLKDAGLYFAQTIIWHKQWPVLTRKDFMGDHEWCFYGWKEGAAHVFLGPNNIGDVWSIRKVTPQSMIHLTEKPVELAVRALQYSSRVGEHVLDLFGGSGSTLIAAEQTERRAFLMELDPLYCDVIVERWERFTGRRACRQAGKAKRAAAGSGKRRKATARA